MAERTHRGEVPPMKKKYGDLYTYFVLNYFVFCHYNEWSTNV